MSNHKSSQRFLRNLRLIVKCGICGHKQKIQFHHIKETKVNGIGRGLWRRAKDIRDHPDCYIPLCYFCHQKVTLREIQIGTMYYDGRMKWRYTDLTSFWREINVI